MRCTYHVINSSCSILWIKIKGVDYAHKYEIILPKMMYLTISFYQLLDQ